MRSLAETKLRWEETFKNGSSISDLQRGVKSNSGNSPCVAGLRSICWKAFLLFPNAQAEEWPQLLRQTRTSYDKICEHHLKYIRHPEQLAALPFDPLADDADSPWIEARQDETIRAEIQQDVSRLPDEPFYHEEATQLLILDILFLYCKLHPEIGGYRQGMHELLAPIVLVVAQDAVSRVEALATEDPVDHIISEMLDSTHIEHDAFALFSRVMDNASAFYEVESDNGNLTHPRNTIVEKSKYIHEVALTKVDKELADHLRNIEVLPQIFLIRWIRLLFGREFPFEQVMALWDVMFALDPNLELIDLICVAMLLRIRWTLLEADYSVALQLMLKYPAPQPPHGPHTFVNDAIYLKNHFDAAGGVALITKYTGRMPFTAAATPAITPSVTPSRKTAPSLQAFGSLRQRTLGARSPLASTTKLLQQPGGVEALLQGAAKNVMERSEKLGLNQAVRDAVGEIRRNVQGLQDARNSPRNGRSSEDSMPLFPDSSLAVTIMERRNHRLAAMLEESITRLKLLAASDFEGDKETQLESVEIASSKIQFVKACLEDSSLALPEEELPSIAHLSIATHPEIKSPTVALDTTPVVMTSSAVEEARSVLSSPGSETRDTPLETVTEEQHIGEAPAPLGEPEKMDTDPPENKTTPPTTQLPPPRQETTPSLSTATTAVSPEVVSPTPKERPKGPIPTRSTLAQSSFAWMLEPDTTMSSATRNNSTFPSNRPSSKEPFSSPSQQKKRQSKNPSRERNAFLFGEVTSEGGDDERRLSADQIFGLQPIRKT
ncbi:rab-GTPase-TBC domain-containing protein [Podospora australis]|uniref:Rab-GTPase-TBC domain-containing protein n=1 Tax=Podospora australis TaxID=1536484 RepID=A0AAN7AHD5_9PEZI|nr:rab-GTPase-TBC domain-containing protein [Podospora australis]